MSKLQAMYRLFCNQCTDGCVRSARLTRVQFGSVVEWAANITYQMHAYTHAIDVLGDAEADVECKYRQCNCTLENFSIYFRFMDHFCSLPSSQRHSHFAPVSQLKKGKTSLTL